MCTKQKLAAGHSFSVPFCLIEMVVVNSLTSGGLWFAFTHVALNGDIRHIPTGWFYGRQLE